MSLIKIAGYMYMYSDICPEKCVSALEGYVKIWHSVRKNILRYSGEHEDVLDTRKNCFVINILNHPSTYLPIIRA